MNRIIRSSVVTRLKVDVNVISLTLTNVKIHLCSKSIYEDQSLSSKLEVLPWSSKTIDGAARWQRKWIVRMDFTWNVHGNFEMSISDSCSWVFQWWWSFCPNDRTKSQRNFKPSDRCVKKKTILTALKKGDNDEVAEYSWLANKN